METQNVVVSDKPTDCNICMEKFTSTLRKAVSCPYCHEYFCIKCVEKYLLNTIEDPHCMACRRGWSQSLLQNFCTKTFLTKTYPEYRSVILLNRSKAFLPRYQEIAEKQLAADKFYNINKPLKIQYNQLYTEIKLQELKLAKLLKNINENKQIASDIIHGRRDLEGTIIPRGNTTTATQTQESNDDRKKFIRRCGVEGCNGFLSSVWKCGICQNWSCPDCFAVKGLDKDREHVCNADDKATADLIRKNSKPCPNCGELIEKSMGCDQMFCTACHVPFSWNKGEVIKTGIIHNPHYYEWLHRNGRGGEHNVNTIVPCGRLPPIHQIVYRIRLIEKYNIVQQMISTIYRTCAHIIDVEQNRYNFQNHQNDDSKNGVDFLLKNKTEEEWKLSLKKKELMRLRSKEIYDVLDAFSNAAIDIWGNIDEDSKTLSLENIKANYDKWLRQFDELRKFINEPLLKISKIYNIVVPMITDKWEFKIYSITKEKAKKKKVAEAAAAAASEPAP
jgi:hypothetical protein